MIEEKFDSDRTVPSLFCEKVSEKVAKRTQEKYDAILNTMQPDMRYKASEIKTIVGVKESRIKVLLNDITE